MTEAYVVAGGLDHFGMRTPEDIPKRHDKSLTTVAEILGEARTFVDSYIELNIPDIASHAPRNLALECIFCNKNYKNAESLRKHEATVHNHDDPKHNGTSDSTPAEPQVDRSDHIREYTKAALTMGLLRMEHNDAISMGDGERIMKVNSVLMLVYKTKEFGAKVSRAPKYAYALLELMAQMKVLLPPKLAYQLKWNRTVNYRGGDDTNFPIDLDVEHCNKFFKGKLYVHVYRGIDGEKFLKFFIYHMICTKLFCTFSEEIKTYRGEFTDTSCQRVSRSAPINEEIAVNFDMQTKVKSPSGKHKRHETWKGDVLKLVGQFGRGDLFKNIPNRAHEAFPAYQANIIRINPDEIRQWIFENMRGFTRKAHYRQFLT